MHRYQVVAILSNLIIIFSIPPKTVTVSQTAFIPQCLQVGSPCGKLLSIAQHPTTGLVYVATEDGLYELDNNLHIVSYTTTAIIAEGVVNDFIILTDSGFVVCRNDESGSCHFRSISSFDVVNGLYQPGVVSKNRHSGSVVSWIANGPDGVTVVNVAVSSDTDGNLPALSTRYLLYREQVTANYSKFMSVLTNKYSSPTGQKYFSGDYKPNLVKPIYGFSSGNYHYLIETQFDKRNLKSKLIQLCKTDVDYKSYIELPIECMTQDGNKMPQAISAYFATDTLSVSFSNLDESDPLSVVCQYNINDFKEQFQERRRECLMGFTETTQLEWNPNIFCPTEAVSADVFNLTRLNDPDFCYDLDTSHPLGGQKPIQKDALFTTSTVVNAITVQEHRNNGTVFFLGDSRGNLVKKRLRKGSWESETTQVFEDGSPVLSPNGLLVDINGDMLYIFSNTKLVKMSAKFYQDPPTRKTPSNQIPTITVICVFIVALLLVVLAGVIFYKRRQKLSWYRTYGR